MNMIRRLFPTVYKTTNLQNCYRVARAWKLKLAKKQDIKKEKKRETEINYSKVKKAFSDNLPADINATKTTHDCYFPAKTEEYILHTTRQYYR